MELAAFNFHEQLTEGIESSRYTTATPVQEKVIPEILAGYDLIASAQTGTGKTAAFLLPLLHKLISNKHSKHTSALIIVPTRELAVQIAQHVEGLAYFTEVSFVTVYGGGDGTNFIEEKKALSNGADIVICTPGKMISHLNMGYVHFDKLQYLILDEADRMLDMGFHDDIMKIINKTNSDRQTLLFSATMPDKIRILARKILKQPKEINIAISKPPEKIKQEAYVVYEAQKIPLVNELLKNTTYKSIIIFCSRKDNVKKLTATLQRMHFNANQIHSDLEQNEREQVLLDFKSKKLQILVATDIVSRGIDIEDIELVLNFDVPNDGEDYVHRIGRTARAASTGSAITFVSDKEQLKFKHIEDLLEKEVPKTPVPSSLGEAPIYNPCKPQRTFNKAKHYKKRKL